MHSVNFIRKALMHVAKTACLTVALTFPGNPLFAAESNPLESWKLESGKGDSAKSLSGKNNGNIRGGLWRKAGKYNYLELGYDNFININLQKPLELKNGMSIEYWICLSTDLKNMTSDWNHFFELKGSSALTFQASKEKAIIYATPLFASQAVFKADTWHHLAITCDKDKAKFFINGQMIADRWLKDVSQFKLPWTIDKIIFKNILGCNGNTIVSDINIFDKALNEKEIEETWMNGVKKKFSKQTAKTLAREKFEIKENFESAIAPEWKIEQAGESGHFTAVVQDPKEVIDGKSSLRAISRFGYEYSFLSMDKLVGKRNYILSFDYKILKKDKFTQFILKIMPTLPADMQDYYLNIPSTCNKDSHWATQIYDSGVKKKLKGEINASEHFSVTFKVAQDGNYKMEFLILGNGSIVIDNIVLSGEKPLKHGVSPVMVAPFNGSTVGNGALDFFWENTEDAIKYELQISRKEDFSDSQSFFIEDNGGDVSYFFPDKELENGKWFWRIRGIDEDNVKSSWSQENTFAISPDFHCKSPEKNISADAPEFIFDYSNNKLKGGKINTPEDVMNSFLHFWNTIPEPVRKNSALSIFPYRYRLKKTEILKLAEFLDKNKVPFYFQLLSGNSPHKGAKRNRGVEIFPLSLMEYIFQNCKYSLGISTGETQVYDPIIRNFQLRGYKVCSKYAKRYIPREFCPQFYLWYDKKLRAESSAYSKILIPTMKNNFYNQLGHASTLGWWLTHNDSNIGLSEESWWWWEAGYGDMNTEAIRVTGTKKWPLRKGNIHHYSFNTQPPTTWGIFMLINMLTGGDVYFYEACSGGWAEAGVREAANAFLGMDGKPTFCAKNVIYPLLDDIAKYKLIPKRKDVVDKIKLAVVIKEKDIPRPMTLGWSCMSFGKLASFFETLYGTRHPYDAIPNISRYYYIPVILEEGISKLPKTIKTVPVDKLRNLPQNAAREYLNQYYPLDDACKGNAFIEKVGKTIFVINTNENMDIYEDFQIVPEKCKVKHFSGKVGVHQYLVGKVIEDKTLFIHVNNRPERESLIEFKCQDKPDLKVVPETALVESKWDDKEKLMKVSVNHKEGAVRLFVK